MDPVLIKRFARSDEVRTFAKGRFEVVRIGPLTVGRASYEPGWKWSEHVGKEAGLTLCPLDHVGFVLSGRARVQMGDGRSYDLSAGDLFCVTPGHDSWVVGDKPYVSIHFLGAEQYAKVR
jgi:quercetin dioxygenase-like cupin family protein